MLLDVYIKENVTTKITANSRYIRVPKSQTATVAYDHGIQESDQIDELRLNEADFTLLYKTGIFDRINKICGTLIDDFEFDSVGFEMSEQCLELIDQTRCKTNNIRVKELLNDLEKMFRLSIKYETLVGFDF